MIDFTGLTGQELEDAKTELVNSIISLRKNYPDDVPEVMERSGVVPDPHTNEGE
jgi:hypothetical protein